MSAFFLTSFVCSWAVLISFDVVPHRTNRRSNEQAKHGCTCGRGCLAGDFLSEWNVLITGSMTIPFSFVSTYPDSGLQRCTLFTTNDELNGDNVFDSRQSPSNGCIF